jgi:hypothetical protein
MIKRLQTKGRRQRLRGGFERSAGQPLDEQAPQQRGRDAMARQDLGQENGKSASAAAALAAIGTKDPLSPGRLAVGFGGIVAVENAVPV